MSSRGGARGESRALRPKIEISVEDLRENPTTPLPVVAGQKVPPAAEE